MQNGYSPTKHTALSPSLPCVDFMSNWNYRIVFGLDCEYALRRVHYNVLGEACAMDGDEITAISDLIEAGETGDTEVVLLECAIVDARKRPVFVVPNKFAPTDADLPERAVLTEVHH